MVAAPGTSQPQAVVVVPGTEPVPKDAFVTNLRLVVAHARHDAEQGQIKPRESGPFRDVLRLKKHIAETFHVQISDMVLFFQNLEGAHSQQLELLDEEYDLKHQGVRSGATVVCQLAEWDKRFSKLGESPYYMWSAQQPAVPEDIRVQRCGTPKQLLATSGENNEKRLPLRTIQNYSWVDESRRTVKLYISVDQEPAALAAAGGLNDGRVRADFQEQSLQVSITGSTAVFSLAIDKLEHAINPDACKVKLTVGKKIAVTLSKAKEDALWNTLIAR